MSEPVRRLALIGAGDLAVTVAAHAASHPDITITGHFDDTKQIGELVAGAPILGGLDDVIPAFGARAFDAVLITIGYKHLAFRAEFFGRLKDARVPLATLVHPHAFVEPTATVREGSILFPGVVIDAGAIIEANCVLNASVTIAHDTTVGPHTFCGPAVAVAGFTRIGSRVFLGIGTVVIDNVTVHEGARTAGGAVVTTDIPPGVCVGGVPAKPLGDKG